MSLSPINTALLGALLSLILNFFALFVSDLIAHRYKKLKIFYIRLIVLLVAAACLALTLYLIMGVSTSVREVFASFDSCLAKNSEGIPFWTFNDCFIQGNSAIFYNIREEHGNCRMLVSYNLGGMSLETPYCGIFSDFSFPPQTVRDASQYSGIEFITEHPDSVPEGVRFYLQVAVLGMPHGAYHEFDFTEQVVSDGPRQILAPFSKFALPPFFPGPSVKLDRKRVFRIGYIVRGQQGQIAQGIFLIDNIRFYGDSTN